MADAKQVLNEVLDYFLHTNTGPGGDWAFPDDGSSLCLDFMSDDGLTKFWIDLERDGTIRLLWRLANSEVKSIKFVAAPVALSSQDGGTARG